MSAIHFYYNWMSPPSRAVWMTLEALGLKYEEHMIDLMKGEQKTAEYKKISFRQKVPAIKIGDFVLAESRAVAGYLVSAYGDQQNKRHMYPEDPQKRAQIDQQLYISENTNESIQSYVNMGGAFFRGEGPKTENMQKAKDAVAQVEEILGDKQYTVGNELTLSDIFHYLPISVLSVSPFDSWGDYPKVAAWRKRIEALPYYEKTCGDPLQKVGAKYREVIEKAAKK